MGNQTVLNKTVDQAVSFWTKYLKLEPEEPGYFELSSEPTVLMMKQKNKNYPDPKVLESFTKKLAVYVILKLEENTSFVIETKEFPIGEFATLILNSGIDTSLFPKSTKMVISLGRIKITNFLGQGETIKIS